MVRRCIAGCGSGVPLHPFPPEGEIDRRCGMGLGDHQANIMFSYNFFRAMLLLFNVLLWLSGLLIILAAIWMQTDFKYYLKISDGYSIYVPYLLLAVGGLLVFAASLACSCIVKVDPTMLIIYGGFLIAAMFSLILLSIYIYAYKDNVISGLPDGFEKEVKSYNKSFAATRNANATLIDYVQSNLGCCGGKSQLDWQNNSLPSSCCWNEDRTKNCTEAAADPIHEGGCIPKLESLISANLTSIGVMLSILALFPLLAMVFAYSLAAASRRMGYQSIS